MKMLVSKIKEIKNNRMIAKDKDVDDYGVGDQVVFYTKSGERKVGRVLGWTGNDKMRVGMSAASGESYTVKKNNGRFTVTDSKTKDVLGNHRDYKKKRPVYFSEY